MMGLGVVGVVVVSLFSASLLAAGPRAATSISDNGGGIEIVFRSDAPSDQVFGELRGFFEDRDERIRLESMTGRTAVVGRVIGDGPGISDGRP